MRVVGRLLLDMEVAGARGLAESRAHSSGAQVQTDTAPHSHRRGQCFVDLWQNWILIFFTVGINRIQNFRRLQSSTVLSLFQAFMFFLLTVLVVACMLGELKIAKQYPHLEDIM
jgi:hypothetical protein